MPFELFRPNLTARQDLSTAPAVKLYKSGTMCLNRAAMKTFGSPPRAYLFFDTSRRLVGLKPAAEGASDSYRLDPETRVVGTPAFFKVHNIPLGGSGPLPASMEDDMLVFSVGKLEPE